MIMEGTEIAEVLTLTQVTAPPPQTGDEGIMWILGIMIVCVIAFIIVSRFKKR